MSNNTYNENDIEVLEGLEPVRKRPGMYIGSTGLRGLHHLVYEIVDNSIDEALQGFCDDIYICLNEDGSVTVKDNGRGMPTGIHPKTKISTVETILTVLHSGGKFGGNGYKISGGLHGVGSSVVNALSEYLEAKIYRENKVHYSNFSQGKTITPLKVIDKCDNTGTEITFKPDKTIFENTTFNYNTLSTRLRELAFLNRSITITFEDKRQNKQINVFHFEGGIKEFIQYLNKDENTLHDLIPYNYKEIEEVDIEFGIQFKQDYSESVYSYVNNIHTVDGGTHLNGLRSGLLKAFNDYALSNNLITNKFVYDDIKEGITAIISIKMREPEFEGQTKTKLGNSYIKKLVEDMIIDYFEVFFKENVDIANTLMDRAITTQNFRENIKKNKQLLEAKKKMNREVLPSKLADCSSHKFEEKEIHIVEGDSAGGSAKSGRNRKTQAILAIRGKILNVEKQRLERILNSETIRDIANAIGTGLGEDFDISKLRYNRICMLVDGDSDGRHIATLILTLMYRYMRPLIENGNVYLDCPPLYRNTIGKEHFYTYTETEQKKFLEINKDKKISEIQRYKGIGEMDAAQLWDTTLNPETRVLKQITLDDAVECDKVFSMLMGDKVEPRKEFLISQSRSEVMDYE